MTDPMSGSPSRVNPTGDGLLGVVDLVAIPESASRARKFVGEKLGDGHPALDDVTLLVSELVTNAIRHSDSRHGGTVTLSVADRGDHVRVDVVVREERTLPGSPKTFAMKAVGV